MSQHGMGTQKQAVMERRRVAVIDRPIDLFNFITTAVNEIKNLKAKMMELMAEKLSCDKDLSEAGLVRRQLVIDSLGTVCDKKTTLSTEMIDACCQLAVAKKLVPKKDRHLLVAAGIKY